MYTIDNAFVEVIYIFLSLPSSLPLSTILDSDFLQELRSGQIDKDSIFTLCSALYMREFLVIGTVYTIG